LLKRFLSIILCLILCSTCGCTSVLEGDYQSVTVHADQTGTDDADVYFTDPQDYAELKQVILSLIENYESSGTIRFYSYDGDVEQDVIDACEDISANTPLGAYSVYYINASVNQIASFYEANISITYRKTKAQISDIMATTSPASFRMRLSDSLYSYTRYCVFETDFGGITRSMVEGYIADAYYSNPLKCVAFPEITVNIYPDTGTTRIIEVALDFPEATSQLKARTVSINDTANTLASSVQGISNADHLISACQQLISITSYVSPDDGIPYPNTEDTVNTAYGALVQHSASSEGYAMAYKAICDILRLDCQVVRGTLDGEEHAWNIVELYGSYYHVDPSMCDVEGMEAAFLLTDKQMQVRYSWDTEQYPNCDGEFTYADFSDSTTLTQ
jgi:hypothetical protein